MLPEVAAMRPLFTILAACKFTLLAACITGLVPTTPAGRALMIDPPALAVRLPALVIVPALTISWTAVRSRPRFTTGLLKPGKPELGKTDESSAPCRLKMLPAVRPATITAGFDEAANTLPLFMTSPLKTALAALLKSIIAVAPLDTFRLPTELRPAASRTAVPRATV